MEPLSLYELHHYQKTSAHQDPLFASMGKEQNRPCKRSSEAKNKPNGFRGTCSEQEEIVKPSKTFWKRVILIVADGHCHRPDGEVLRKARSKEASAQRILEASAGAQSGPRNRKRGTTFVLLNFFFFICVASTPNNTFWASQINCWNWAFVDFFSFNQPGYTAYLTAQWLRKCKAVCAEAT